MNRGLKALLSFQIDLLLHFLVGIWCYRNIANPDILLSKSPPSPFIRSRDQRIPNSATSTLSLFLPTSTLNPLPSSTLTLRSISSPLLHLIFLIPFAIPVIAATGWGCARSNPFARAGSGEWVAAADGRRRMPPKKEMSMSKYETHTFSVQPSLAAAKERSLEEC